MGLSAEQEVAAWAASGAAWLTGRDDGPPLGPPRGFVSRATELGRALGLDGLGVLVERAALVGLARGGDVSCGGATRLLVASDGEHVALSLARPDDWSLLPALFELSGEVAEGDWDGVAELVGRVPACDLVDRGAGLLGLPMSRLGELGNHRHDPSPSFPSRPHDDRSRRADGLLVVDLSGLWAGPLAASVLADAGASVVKVESIRRPDGARSGSLEVFDLLNAGKESVALDLADAEGRAALGLLVEQADVVVSAARARALDQLGLDPAVSDGVWLSITGHGLDVDRVAFGDDAAVAGGLVVRDEDGPCFCVDAVADPLAGLVGAAAVLDALATDRRGLIDVSMAAVAASFAGPTLPMPPGIDVAPPQGGEDARHRPCVGDLVSGLLIRDAELDGRRVDVRCAGGLVAEIGERITRRPGDEVLEAGGGALLPGLHDHHLHLLAMAAASRAR